MKIKDKRITSSLTSLFAFLNFCSLFVMMLERVTARNSLDVTATRSSELTQFTQSETFIPLLLLKNKLRQSLQCITKMISHSLVVTNKCRKRKDASTGKSSFLCYDEVLISNRWQYSECYSYLLKEGVHATLIGKPKTHCDKRENLLKPMLDDVTGLHMYLIILTSSSKQQT